MSDRSDDELVPLTKATEMGPILWISIGLGTVGSLPMLSGIADGSVSPVRGATWFLVITLVAMIGVWTLSWLMHVFSDPWGDDDVDDDADDEIVGAGSTAAPVSALDDSALPTVDDVPAPAMSDAP